MTRVYIDVPRFEHPALCAETDPEMFFPEVGQSTRDAKRVCMGCEARTECLQWALDHDAQFGVWGGLSRHQRLRLQGRKKDAA